MVKKKLLERSIKQLIELGKKKGYLTYDQVNDILPADVLDENQIDDVMTMFGEMDIIESIDFMIHKMLGLICHQDPSIILYVQGHSMPLCPRCTGMHIGFFLGIVSIWLFRDSVWQHLARINTIMVFIPVSIMGMEWFLSNCNLISSNTTSRLLTGFLGGLGICVFLIIYQNRHSLQITAILNKK